MAKLPTRLTQAHIDRLLDDPSAEHRAETAALVGEEFTAGTLTAGELRIAIDILEILARDVEQQVRQAVSEHVKTCPYLPPGLARRLADDIEAVAVPIIRHSGVLSETDLIEIIGSGNEAKQLAIALRDTVEPAVSEALVRNAQEAVVSAVLINQGAALSDQSLHVVLDRLGHRPGVQQALVERAALPVTVMERVMSVVSAELQERLIARHALPPEFAQELVQRGRERALTQSLAAGTTAEAEVERLTASMAAKGRLTSSLLLRCLCQGDLAFFEAGMARRAHVPTANARLLIQDPGPLGLAALYRRAKLPEPLLPAFRAATEVLRSHGVLTGKAWRPAYTMEIIDRLAAIYDEVSPEGLDDVITALGRVLGKHWSPVRRDSNAR